MGRGKPCCKDTKRELVAVRLSNEDMQKLDEMSLGTGLARSEILRKGLRSLYNLFRITHKIP